MSKSDRHPAMTLILVSFPGIVKRRAEVPSIAEFMTHFGRYRRYNLRR